MNYIQYDFVFHTINVIYEITNIYKNYNEIILKGFNLEIKLLVCDSEGMTRAVFTGQPSAFGFRLSGKNCICLAFRITHLLGSTIIMQNARKDLLARLFDHGRLQWIGNMQRTNYFNMHNHKSTEH